jgi:O-antigen/teichoic acid export membrane protein
LKSAINIQSAINNQQSTISNQQPHRLSLFAMLRNIGSNWALILVTIAGTYVLTPFIIHTLGQDGYGTWTLITAMTGYMSLLALGVPMACVRYLAQDVAENDARKMNATIASCAGLYLVIGGAALLIGAGLAVLFALTYDLPSSLRAEARMAFGLMVVHVSAGFIGLLPEGIMFAHHDFVVRNVVRMSGLLLRVCLTIGLLTRDASLILLAAIQIACLVFDFAVSWLLIRRRYPGVRIGVADFDWGVLRRIFSFSLFVLLLNAGARLSFETDALVIGAFSGVGAIPFYAVANSLVVYLMDFVVAIAAVVSPMATKLHTQGQVDQLREMFLRWSKVALSLTIMAGLFLVVLGPSFIGWWIEPSYVHPSGQVLRILMVSSFVFLPVRGVALPVLMGIGKPRIPTIAFLIAGVLNLALSMLLIGPLGLAGVALGTAIPNVLFALVILNVACRELSIAAGSYLKYVVPRAACGALPILMLLLWCKVNLDVDSIGGLVTAGSAMVVLFAVTWAFFVYRDDPYVDLRMHLLRRSWRWSRA